jgi:hypothetical protein
MALVDFDSVILCFRRDAHKVLSAFRQLQIERRTINLRLRNSHRHANSARRHYPVLQSCSSSYNRLSYSSFTNLDLKWSLARRHGERGLHFGDKSWRRHTDVAVTLS